MTTIKAFIKSHPLLSFFALVFAISWGGILLVVGGPGGLPATKEQAETLMLFVLLALFAGPSVAGILLTGLLYGRAGLRELLSRLLRWRVGTRWYAVALLTAPLLFTAVLLGLSLSSSVFLPRILTSSDKASLLLMGIVVGLGAGIFEELGWTGFAIPRMRLRYDVLATGFIVGVLWGAWHFFMNFWASGVTSGELSMAIFVPTWLLGILVGQLTAYRVLMVWVNERTGGSLLMAMLMHVSFAASTVILMPPVAGVASVILSFVPAAALWVVGAVAIATRGQLSRQPPLRRKVA